MFDGDKWLGRDEEEESPGREKKEWVGAMEVTVDNSLQPGKNWATISLQE